MAGEEFDPEELNSEYAQPHPFSCLLNYFLTLPRTLPYPFAFMTRVETRRLRLKNDFSDAPPIIDRIEEAMLNT